MTLINEQNTVQVTEDAAIHRLQPSQQAPRPELSDGHAAIAIQPMDAIGGNDGAHRSRATHSQVSPVIAQIIQLGRMRRRWHKAEKSLILQGKAMARAFTNGDNDEANRLYDIAEKGGDVEPDLAIALMPFFNARQVFATERAQLEKTMRKLAKSLPVWPWVENVKGLGDLRLAIIVGECGDIGAYRNPSCLWKRMGLAVMNGERQRRVAGNPDLAVEHGYNAERRAIAYVMGTEIIKAQIRNVKDDEGKRTDESIAIGPYGQLYLDRKAYEAAREGITKAHANNRAARYMVKRVLRDLYAAWRKS